MTSLVALGSEVMHVLFRAAAERALVSDDIDVSPAQRPDLLGIVGDERHARHAQLAQHFGREIEAALVETEAENFIGIIGVIAIMLQTIGIDLVGDAVTAPLLVEIKQHAAAILGHILHGAAQLIAAITFERTEQIARQAGRMQPHRNRARKIGIADDDGDLIAQTFTATEHDKFGLRRIVERNRRAADDRQLNRHMTTISENVARFCRKQARHFAFAGKRNENDRRRNERERAEFKRGTVGLVARAHRRIDARINLERQRFEPREIEAGQGDTARHFTLEPEMAQARRRNGKPGPPFGERFQRVDLIGFQRANREREGGRAMLVDFNRATGAELGDRTFNGGLAGRCKQS